MRVLIVAALAALLCACATGRDPNYEAALQAHAAAQERQQAQIAAIQAESANCTDDACRVALAGFAALTAQGGARAPIPTYTPQTSTAAKIGLALIGQLGPIANAAVSWHQSDNARDTSLAQFDFLGGVVSDVAAVATGATTAAANASPSINVGGDYITGDGNATRESQIGDSTTTTVGRDQTAGDHNDGAVIGDDNRFDSPGPIDQSNDGDDCTGTGCQAPPPGEGE